MKGFVIERLYQQEIGDVKNYFQKLIDCGRVYYRFFDIFDPTWEFIVKILHRNMNTTFIVKKEGVIIGEFVLESFSGNSAQMHFSFSPELSFRETIQVGNWVLDSILNNWKVPENGQPQLDVIFGIISVEHKVGLKYSKMVGFKKLCVMPSCITFKTKITDAELLVRTRTC